MKRKVRATVEKYGMLKKGDSVVVGLSGGADSVALTHILLSLKDELGITVTACHLNHGIRGGEAKRDEDFVRSFCEKYDINLIVSSVNIPVKAEQTGESVEECGRHARYEFFSAVACENGIIATAHNLNDSVETVFLNLARGTGLKGLCGIPPKRDNIIRPLIECTREEIENYCLENGLSYVTDSTNEITDYSRNAVRHGILPVMKKINPSFLSVMLRSLDNLNGDEEFISHAADEYISSFVIDGKTDAKALSDLPLSVKKRVISALCLKEFGFLPEKKHIELIDSFLTSGGAVELKKDCFAVTEKGKFFLTGKNYVFPPFEYAIDSLPATVKTRYGKIILDIIDIATLKDLQTVQKNVLENCIDCDKIKGNVFLRSRKDGDRISLVGRGVTKTLKKLFLEEKIPVENRNQIAVLADENGVIFVEGFGVDERVKITDGTKRAVVIKKGNDYEGRH